MIQKPLNAMQRTFASGQSIWIDYIERSFITSGELGDWIKAGVRGLTSNPAIFQKAISASPVYDEEILKEARSGHPAMQIYESLALKDIRAAAELFRPVFKQSDGDDGYVSLEVNPSLANDTAATIAEARRLFAAAGAPNLMIKIPATEAGIPAITEVIASGINVNVTLLFGHSHYLKAAEAYLQGVDLLIQRGGDPANVASVASFFVSRLDTVVDESLKSLGIEEGRGRTAVTYAAAVFDLFADIFSSLTWERLAKQGARIQRLLWASTGTKNPVYPDTLYVDKLVGENTVNTVPPATLKAFVDHGRGERVLPLLKKKGADILESLPRQLLSLPTITDQLQRDGVAAFAASFSGLLASVNEKIQRLTK